MAKSKAYLGLKNAISIKLGLLDGKLFLGGAKIYPLEKPIADAVVSCSSAVYNGSVQIAQNIVVTLSGKTLVSGTDYVVTENNGGTNAGTYSVVVTGAGDYTGTTSGTFSIAKAACCSTAPTAKSLTYSRNAQALVNAGNSSCGTMQYCATQSGTYTTTIPTQTNAGTYTTYWKVSNDSNHSGTCSGTVVTTIAKQTPVLSTSPSYVSN